MSQNANLDLFRNKPHIYYDPREHRWIAYYGWICGWGDTFQEAWHQLNMKKGMIQL